jgi:N4-gp56 family major capsid protein
MADTPVAAGLTVQNWDSKFFTQYLSQNRFSKEMGTSSNNIIQLKSDLTKKKGDSITYALVNRLAGAGVTGRATLEGNEEEMDSRSFKLTVNKIRNAVRVAEVDEQFSAISLRDAAKEVLMDWIMEKTRDEIITALGSINGVAFGSATQAQRDGWLDDNFDRVLFGDAIANADKTGGTVAYDFSDSLTAITTGMKLTAASLQLMKRIAQTASPKIRPVRTTEDELWYVLYTDSRCFRDLKADTVITAAQREAWTRGKENPLFSGGDIIYDGIIVKEIPDIASLGLVGAGGTTAVSPAYLCGAQALGFAWAKKTKTVTEVFDYGDKVGVACEEIRGIGKMRFGSHATVDTNDLKDHGVVTGYFGAAADA